MVFLTRVIDGGPLTLSDETLHEMFFRVAAEHPTHVGFRAREPDRSEHRDYTYREAAERATNVALGLIDLGVRPKDMVALVCDTRFEWTVADFAIQANGGTIVTVYPTLTATQTEFILNDSGAVGVFAEDEAQLAKVLEIWPRVKTLQWAVTIDPTKLDTGKRTVLTLPELEQRGVARKASFGKELEKRRKAVKQADLVSIVYTSGTTGVPKGAMLTHRNFYAAASAVQRVIPAHLETVCMCFLPLAHVYQRLINFQVIQGGGQLVYTNPKNLSADLARVQPTTLASVPRLYERMNAQIQAGVADMPPRRQRIFRWAERVAKEYGRATSAGGRPGPLLAFRHGLADRLVYRKVRVKLGGTRLRYVITGAAAINKELLYFFRGIGIPILEGYGLTETSAPSHVNHPDRFKPGTVGPPIPGLKYRLEPVEGEPPHRGEVVMTGANVFGGYWNRPDETKAVFTADGWFKSGDIGEADEEGYLRIVDRLKEIEKLSTGKMVAPVPIEEGLKTSPFVGEALMVASERKFVGMLVFPAFDYLLKWAKKEGIPFDASKVKTAQDPTGATITVTVGDDLLGNPKVLALYQAAIEDANKGLARFEMVKKFALAPRILSPQADELTPTLKKKRRNIKKSFERQIEGMFAGEA